MEDDPRDDAAALALAVGRTRISDPDRSADVLRGALADHRGDLTIADAAAKSGLPLRDAELGLHRLLQVHRGHLSVTDRGELLFRFSDGIIKPFGGAMGVLRLLGRGALGLVRWTGRLALTLFILGYSLVAALALLLGSLALAILAEDGGPVEAAGYIVWATFEMIGDALFWTFHPLRAPDELDDTPHRQPRAFYQRVNGLFLGPPRRDHDPQAAARLLVAEIRARQGRIGLGDVVRVTGLLPDAAGPLVSRLLVDYDGHVDVTCDGAIVYSFPALRPSVGEHAPAAPPAIWRRERPLAMFTGNTGGTNAKILALLSVVAAFGYFGMWLELSAWFGAFPFYGSLLLVALIVLRIPMHIAGRRADRRENGRRAVLRLAHDGACERQGVPTHAFAEAYHAAADLHLVPSQLQKLLVDLGGDLVIADDGSTAWRFPTLELELGALALVRARADAAEQTVGTVEFSSLPAPDEQPERPALPQPARTRRR